MEKRNYFVFNKELDFKRCFLWNMRYEDHKLKAPAGGSGHSAYLISRVLDSRETDMEWHQFVCRMHNQGNTAAQLSVYTADSLFRQTGEREEPIESILFDTQRSLQEKKDLLRPYLKKTVRNTDDILLHDVSGRYLWFLFEAVLQAGQHLEIAKIKIYFPRQSWNAYLPEIYQQHDPDGFFERFLAVFQTMYESFNRKIRRIPYDMDVDCAGREFLEWLAEWLALAQTYMWTDDQLRRLLKNAGRLYKIRGTRRAVVEFVKLYTNDAEVYVVENFQIRNTDREQLPLMERLYGTDPYKFQVIVHEKDVPSIQAYQTLLKIIKEVKSAHMELELIVLKPYMFLGRHTYLGMNSVLGIYQELSLDGAAMLPFAVLGGEPVRGDVQNETDAAP